MDNTHTPSSSNFGRQASNVVNEATAFASNVADTVTESAAAAEQKASEFSKAASDKLSAAADYFRDREFNEMATDLNDFVKAHPTQALLGAAALGFAAATLLRRR